MRKNISLICLLTTEENRDFIMKAISMEYATPDDNSMLHQIYQQLVHIWSRGKGEDALNDDLKTKLMNLAEINVREKKCDPVIQYCGQYIAIISKNEIGMMNVQKHGKQWAIKYKCSCLYISTYDDSIAITGIFDQTGEKRMEHNFGDASELEDFDILPISACCIQSLEPIIKSEGVNKIQDFLAEDDYFRGIEKFLDTFDFLQAIPALGS